ncbi:unknown [Roseburia sp. CAG:309]|nr:unknown [Roseburia sp. CAG:309]
MFYFQKCLRCDLTCLYTALAENFHDSRNVFFQFMAACLDWLEFFHQNGIEELLHFDIAEPTFGIVIFQFLKVGIFRKMMFEVSVVTKGIQISKYRVPFEFSGIFDADVIRIGVHTHDLFADIVRGVRKIDAVAKRFTHFCFSIGSRKAHTSLIIWEKCFWHNENFFSVNTVKTMHDLASLFQHWELVLAHRHDICFKSCDISCLTDRIGKKSDRDTGIKSAELNFTFYGRISF